MNIIIIGGGAVGLSCAYYLQRAGHRLTILDDQPEQAVDSASHGNAGMVVPSHFVPLAAPGVVAKGLKWMLRTNSPFSIRATLQPELLRWLWLFRKSATRQHVSRSAPILRDLGLASRQLYNDLAQELGIFVGSRGLNMIYQGDACEREEHEVAELAEQLGVPVQVLDAQALQDMEPNAQVQARGAVHYPLDGHIHPHQFMHALGGHLRREGVIHHARTRVTHLGARQGRVCEVRTGDGAYEADAYVLAAGAWSGKLARHLNLRLPLQGGKGYSLSPTRLPLQLRVPSILCEAKVAVTPMGNQLRFAGTMEIGSQTTKVSAPKLQGMLASIPGFFPQLSERHFEGLSVWTGLRPCSPDGLPYIGRSQQYPNLLMATGHAMMGISLAPITGKLIAEVLSESSPSLCLEPFSPDRFG